MNQSQKMTKFVTDVNADSDHLSIYLRNKTFGATLLYTADNNGA